MSKKKSTSKKHKIVVSDEHYIKVCQVLIASIILEEDFSKHIEPYHQFGPDSIEEMVGNLAFPFAVEMSLVENITGLLCDEETCSHCVLASSIEIEDPYLRRRHFRISEFLIDEWKEIGKLAQEYSATGNISSLIDDEMYLEAFKDTLQYFDESSFNSEPDFMLDTKKEIKMLN